MLSNTAIQMDDHLQHLQTTPLQELAQGVVDLPVSARIAMNVLAPTELPAASPAPSSYIELFTQIAILQANGDHYGLIEAAERADLAVTYDNHPTRLLITVPLVLSCLIVNDLLAEFDPSLYFCLTINFHRPSAKFALMRLPDAIAALPLARAVLNLFASVWERRYEHVYSRGEALFNFAQQGDFAHTEVVRVLTTLVTAFIESFRKRTVDLLSKAYTTVPLALAQVYLGLSADKLLSIASEKRWHVDTATQIMTPNRVIPKISLSASAQSITASQKHCYINHE
ncbi:hypothetical protein BJV74DRAFT_847876 [Russula compacta]|nr:hypothetical protein BJV74DRAFT_847876 [Russula compacta]